MTFRLQIVTPDGLAFEGEAEKISVRTQDGIIGILPRHIDYVAPLGMGEAVVTVDGQDRRAACIGGMVAVHRGDVRLVATTFEWAEDIDVERAKEAELKARSIIAAGELDERSLKLAESRLHRALVRQSVGRGK